jgi:hypothetical protein
VDDDTSIVFIDTFVEVRPEHDDCLNPETVSGDLPDLPVQPGGAGERTCKYPRARLVGLRVQPSSQAWHAVVNLDGARQVFGAKLLQNCLVSAYFADLAVALSADRRSPTLRRPRRADDDRPDGRDDLADGAIAER